MFACGGKSKKANQQNTILLEDKCKIHNNAFDCVSLNYTDKSQTFKACPLCKQQRTKEQFVTFKEIQNKLQTQISNDLVGEFKLKMTQLFNETEQFRTKLIQTADSIHEILVNGIHELFVNSLFKKLPNNLFTIEDIFDLVTTKTIEAFSSIMDQQIQFQKGDDTSTSLLTKILFHEQESRQFIDALKDAQGVKKKLEKINNDFTELKNEISKKIQQISKKSVIDAPKVDLQEPTLQFLIEKNKQEQDVIVEQIKTIQGVKDIIIEPSQIERQENPQVKSIISIDQKLLAYSSGTRIFIFDKTKNFSFIQQVDCENDISALCSVTLDKKTYIIASVEENEESFQLQFWDWENFDKWKVINAHDKYIWQIINLPKNLIASCSEDGTIKIFNALTQQQVQKIAVHQASVNDIALITPEIIASVSDDGTLVASNFLNGDLVGIVPQDNEIKSVIALDGIRFVTGNSSGEIRIYTFVQSIETQQVIKAHDSVVRFLSRIDQKLFVTSSWDGTHKFISVVDGEIKVINGPKKNFPEPLLWIQDIGCLVASAGGILQKYK
ncbi:unnamed protein product [Paramecium primaurelia]|uniref:Uncharacterized protein n=1 Tax=Paramecium primaurelia TaxID=5886 RepID=A0A8S1JYT7_PARPR|nr:unnamed protein product [Paramecium primaurelia]